MTERDERRERGERGTRVGFETPEEQRPRIRVYVALMLTCVTLFVLAGTVLPGAARIVAVVVAAAIPPFAAIIANAKRD